MSSLLQEQQKNNIPATGDVRGEFFDGTKWVKTGEEFMDVSSNTDILKKVIEVAEQEKKTGANKKYDGNDLSSACDEYGIAAESWSEIIRYEDGFNSALSLIKSYCEEQLLDNK